ncbi:MAG: carboxylate--amine ligase [Oscillospiraceae bacterium]|nr:carboxylate--amine ligase [Oscillospiraceae bacterium]
MGKLSYALHILKGAKLKKCLTVVDAVHEKTGKSKLFLLADIAVCAVRYGAGYNDYNIFAFYNMNHAQRSTYITRVKNKKIIAYLNNPDYYDIFDMKNIFDAKFKDFIRRDFLDVAEMSIDDLMRFIEGKKSIFAKPNDSESGKGIEKLDVDKFASVEELFEYIRKPEKNFGVVEELIVQHEDMARLYPYSVNTIRICTVVGDNGKDVYCGYATVKMGNEGKFVDNMENSGLACPIDQETGEICGVAHTSKLINFDTHPYTGVPLIGYKVPYAKEAIELCKKAALVVPQMRYIGWDCCIMPDGPAIVEGNNYAGYDFSQLPEHRPEKVGDLPFFRQFVPGL